MLTYACSVSSLKTAYRYNMPVESVNYLDLEIGCYERIIQHSNISFSFWHFVSSNIHVFLCPKTWVLGPLVHWCVESIWLASCHCTRIHITGWFGSTYTLPLLPFTFLHSHARVFWRFTRCLFLWLQFAVVLMWGNEVYSVWVCVLPEKWVSS